MINDIWVVMGYANRVDLTKRSIQQLLAVSDKINLLVINNGSQEAPLTIPEDPINGYKSLGRVVFTHNEENLGCLPLLRQALPYLGVDDIVVFMHNDVLIWRQGWDTFVRNAFDGFPELGLAGLFGAPGVAADGGRMFPKSCMQGWEWGTDWAPHGGFLDENVISPAAVLDSLCMIFRASALMELGVPADWPPHHWFDRLFCAYFIENNYKVATLGIPFDHFGGGSSGDVMDEFVIRWVKDNLGKTLDATAANEALYLEGLKIWNFNYAHRMALISDGWDYIWRTGRQ